MSFHFHSSGPYLHEKWFSSNTHTIQCHTKPALFSFHLNASQMTQAGIKFQILLKLRCKCSHASSCYDKSKAWTVLAKGGGPADLGAAMQNLSTSLVWIFKPSFKVKNEHCNISYHRKVRWLLHPVLEMNNIDHKHTTQQHF